MHDSVLTINCSSNYNLRSLVVTRESIWRLCGYGATAADRSLDDQVSIYNYSILYYYFVRCGCNIHGLKSLILLLRFVGRECDSGIVA